MTSMGNVESASPEADSLVIYPSVCHGADLKEVIKVSSKGASSTDDGAHNAQRRSDL